jgi:sirohydrochlorin ferrochelatase
VNSSRPVLIAVAHGSRDPAAQRAVRAIRAQVSSLAPSTDVRTAFLQNAEPSLPSVLAGAVRQIGPAAVIVVPLLLSAGYHVRHDIARAAAATHTGVAAPLGPDERLVPALADRLAQAGVPAGTPVVLAAAGSSDPQAAAGTEHQARLLADHLGVPVATAHLSASRPAVGEEVAALSARTGAPVAVAAYLLAPGLFHDRLRRTPAAWVSGPLAGHPAVASLILHRYQAEAGRAAEQDRDHSRQ